jgi:hypothetical protein
MIFPWPMRREIAGIGKIMRLARHRCVVLVVDLLTMSFGLITVR